MNLRPMVGFPSLKRHSRALIAAILVVAGAGEAVGQSILQVDPDEIVVIVQKDFGSERWSVIYDRERKTALGNVFKTDGSEPSFLWCTTVSETASEITFDCSAAPRCTQSDCPGSRPDGRPDWQFLARQTLPKSFFGIEGGGSSACSDWFVALQSSGIQSDGCGLRLVLNNQSCSSALSGLSGTIFCEQGGSGQINFASASVPGGTSGAFDFEANGCAGATSVTVTSGGTTKTSNPVSCDCRALSCGAPACGGFAGLPCPSDQFDCVDNPGDGCDPERGGADCIGVCVPR